MEAPLSRQLVIKDRGIVEELEREGFFKNGKTRVAAQPRS